MSNTLFWPPRVLAHTCGKHTHTHTSQVYSEKTTNKPTRMVSRGSYTWMFCQQVVELSGKDGGVALMEKEWYSRQVWRFQKPMPFPVSSGSASNLWIVSALATAPAPCLSACCHPSYHDGHELTLWAYKQSPNQMLSAERCLSQWCLSQQSKTEIYGAYFLLRPSQEGSPRLTESVSGLHFSMTEWQEFHL